jgi:hypothetical protein
VDRRDDYLERLLVNASVNAGWVARLPGRRAARTAASLRVVAVVGQSSPLDNFEYDDPLSNSTEILPGRPERPFRDLGPIEAGAGYWPGGVISLFSKGKTENADRNLRTQAAKRGADAVMEVTYSRKSATENVLVGGSPLRVRGRAIEYEDDHL